MIKIEHAVFPSAEQMKFIIEGMRNPMNSWDKSDSEMKEILTKHFKYVNDACGTTYGYREYMVKSNQYVLGKNDSALMKKLADAGTDHRKFMRMMPVMARITAPLYWWKEFDTYKVGTVANSCSTMHKIADKPFDISDFSCEHLVDTVSMDYLEDTIKRLNWVRDCYLEDERKDLWWQMIQLLPSSYNQTRNVYMNYEVLSNIYFARKNHKLDEWQEFCNWIDSNPYIDILLA